MMKTRTEKVIVLLVINLFCIVFTVFLGHYVIHKWQERHFQEQIQQTIDQGSKLAIAQNSHQHSGWIGDQYVIAYYPQRNDQELTLVKEKMDSEIKKLQESQPMLADEMKEIVFFGSEEIASGLAGVRDVQIKKVQHHLKNHKVEPAEETELVRLHLGEENQIVSLADLFLTPDEAKESFLQFIQQQLTFRGLSEEETSQTIEELRSTELSQWQFSYVNATFAIQLVHPISSVTAIDVLLSELYSSINSSYLQGEDLTKYQAYEEQRHKKVVALTFDDGPNSITTPQALDILKKYKAKATFFMVGKAVAGNEAIIQRVLKEGHAIGNHSWNHPVLTTLTLEQAQQEINATTVALEKAGVTNVHLMRPPYGAINQTIQNAVNQSFIMWDIDSLDWKTHNTAAIMEEVKKTQPGSIILMHDIHQTTIDALPTVIQYLKSQGFELVTVDELLGNQLELHRAYYSRN